SNIRQRLEYHNSGKSRYTSRKMPWELVYFERFESKTGAIKRERFLKKQKNTRFYLKLINGQKK
ncbi:MAG: GIY-YIG nuclease family protein, partial [Chlorobi bacterium]|nr:GIY-YIG nuclease family protein [Chlorobiota bacterium]